MMMMMAIMVMMAMMMMAMMVMMSTTLRMTIPVPASKGDMADAMTSIQGTINKHDDIKRQLGEGTSPWVFGTGNTW